MVFYPGLLTFGGGSIPVTMNPSASGWIDKFGVVIKDVALPFSDTGAFYGFLRSSGFIYGLNVAAIPGVTPGYKPTEEELAKLNLITAFYTVYRFENGSTDFKRFVESLLDFYKNFEAYHTPGWKKLFTAKKASVRLEKYIRSRVQLDENLLTKNFSKLLINFLLFTDVLAYRVFLHDADAALPYFKSLENAIISLTYDALDTREKKTKYHNRLMKLLRASLRYREKDGNSEADYNSHIAGLTHPLEKRYMLDLAAMVVWEDRITEPSEMAFIHRLCNDLKLPPEAAGNAIANVNDFYERYKDELPYLNDGNFARNFYDNASKMVSTLIIRNKKRLQQELLESKELVVLLSQATSRELSKAEKQKVKAQLTDIFKMIPSLAIFALPGGGVLLPLFVKLIPKLLPSSFDDNRIEPEK